tara:strand:- start:256 stop:843 length:588 start_codon:yes stop_codon:yes gene_type:complete
MPIKIVAKKKSKKDPFRADKTESLNKDFSKRTAKANQEAMKNVKKKMGGGMMNKKSMGYAGGGLTKGMLGKDVLLGKKSPADVLKENKKKALKKKKVIKKAEGGSLKPVPEGNKGKGLSKLPTEVRNKMGFMKKGGKLTSNKAKIKKVTTGLRKAVKAHTGQAKMLSSIKLNKGGKMMKMRGGGMADRGISFRMR